MQCHGGLKLIWKFLHEQYSATTTFSKATVHKSLGRMKYTGQPMHEKATKCESHAAQMALMDAPMDEDY